MKLGVSYNVFDGIELLEPSVLSIRGNVDHISVVYQDVSNRLIKSRYDIFPILKKMKDICLIDDIIKFSPKIDRPIVGSNVKPRECHQNEIQKREIGRKKAIECGCDYFLSMDVDEFYISEDFKSAKNKIIENGIDLSVCKIQPYLNKPTYKKIKLDDYHVPFIQKSNLKLSLYCDFPVVADPTRKAEGFKNFYEFSDKELIMHHMTHVRSSKKSLEYKFMNSSAKDNFGKIPHLLNYILSINETSKNIELCEDIFSIEKHFEKFKFQ